MKKLFFWLTVLFPVAAMVGCGGGTGSGTGGATNALIGDRLGAAVYMQPGPPPYQFSAWSGSGPGIRIDQVLQFPSTVHPDGTGIYEGTSQVAYGQITGSTSGVQVVTFSLTNFYWIQPLTSTTIRVNSDSTWIAPAHPGGIAALLVRAGYSLPDTMTALPAVDGVDVLAVAMQP